ncbi:hypothetical protein DYB32_001337 [Aphanomyces invadans]|uniref:Uncharacterized protein n=1 Tax=Aphanomyces invadans TaxID=157072 RepID=A0A418B8C7_9STRA|nr:hypothetical protein DYB32_001337 [Aphanomyces invadans]
MWSSQYSEDDEDVAGVSQDMMRECEEDLDNDPGLKVVEGDSLAEEMTAMKEVFLRMSEKVHCIIAVFAY